MPISLHAGVEQLLGFLLTMTRVGSALLLFPMPGFQNSPQIARIALIAGTTLCLFPLWGQVAASEAQSGIVLAILSESAVGLLFGLIVSFLAESLQLGAQAISFQTGFSFASTFDPQSQADSGVFQILIQLATGLLYFSLGIHEHLLRMFALSFNASMFDKGAAKWASVDLIIKIGGEFFLTGLKLALPVATLLFLVDQGLAAVTRLHSQLQLLTLAFPVKIVLALVFFGLVVQRWPVIYANLSRQMFGEAFRLLAP
jgi:flagellar biosynthesis protein FliR